MRIKIDKIGEFGLVVDPTPQDIPPNAWTAVENVRFDLGSARNAGGYEVFATPTETATYLLGFDSGGIWNIVYPTANGIFSYVGGVETDISRATAYTASYDWNGCLLSGVAIVNNYSDCPQYWGGSGDCVDLIYSGANSWDDYDGNGGEYRAKVIRSYKAFLFALGISQDGVEYPYMVHWSDPADPGAIPASWDYTDPTTLSGRTDLGDTAGFVVDAVPLRDVLCIYKEDSVWIASYVGGQYQFRFDKLADAQGLGIYSRDCAVDIGGRHVVIGDGIVYMHDGNSVTNILKGRAAESFFQAIDPQQYQLTFAFHYPASSEVFLCYPPVGATTCTRAYVYNYVESTWSWREMPAMLFAATQVVSSNDLASWPTDSSGGGWGTDLTASWDSRNYSPISDTIIAAGASLWMFSDIPTFDGAAPTCRLERTSLRLGDGGQVSLLREIYPRITGTEIDIRIGYQMHVGDSITWGDPQTFNPETMTKIDVLQAGVFHSIRFSTNLGRTWRLDGYELDIDVVGVY